MECERIFRNKSHGDNECMGSNPDIIPSHKRKDNDMKVFQGDLYFVEIDRIEGWYMLGN